MSWTLEEAQNHLRAWLDAELAISTGQRYKIGSRELVRADLSQVKERIQFWQNEVIRLERGNSRGARVFRVVPRDL